MPTYSPDIFNVRNLEEAKRIILTEETLGTEERWMRETPYLRDRMLAALPAHGTILDFGCGVGRLAKAWLEVSPAGNVLGVDISVPMRQLAPGYVGNERFAACGPEFLMQLIGGGFRFDGAVACWIIQHVLDAAAAIDCLHSSLKPVAPLLVVNTLRRVVPTDQGWADDGFDVAKALAERFEVEQFGQLPLAATSPHISHHTFIALYRKR